MKKLQTVMLALVAMFAFSALVVSSAFAEETLIAKWLTGAGNNIAAGVELGTETGGEILLEDVGFKAATLCSGILVGTVSAEGKDLITAVLNLKKELIAELAGLALSSAGGDCVNDGGCGTPIEVWPMHLPWPTQLLLMENGEILDMIENAEYTSLCTVIFDVEDTCVSALTELKVENDAVTGDAENPGSDEALPLGNCSLGGVETGKNITDELAFIVLTNGELLSVSSE